jgi:hypothetical protein
VVAVISTVNRPSYQPSSAVRLINRTSRMEHITPQLAAVHWLPIRYRIDFKVATLAFRCVHGTAPAYLTELLSLQTAMRSGLRSEKDTLKLVGPPAKKIRWGERSFSSSAPRIWNGLPLELRSLSTLTRIRSRLKTYYYRLAFPSPPKSSVVNLL